MTERHGSAETHPAGSTSARPVHPPASFKIRRLRASDLWAVAKIEWNAFPDDPWTTTTARGWLARSPVGNRPPIAVRFARLMRLLRINQSVSMIRLFGLVALKRPVTGSCVVAVAEAGAVVAGYATLRSVPGDLGDVQMIAVEPGYQGQGIGGALLLDLMATAAARGCPGTSLYVRADNPRACRLYRRMGLAEVGTLPGYYQPSGTDALMMQVRFEGQVGGPAPRPPG